MSAVAVSILDKPSNSKGWGRYAVDQDGRKVVESRTGNQWVSANHAGDAQPGSQITLTMQVMLRVGNSGRQREEVSKEIHTLIVEDGASCEIEFRPGSQGLRLAITGARQA